MPPTAACGDGILNGSELCDPKIAAGQAGACPTADSCKSDKACLVVKLAGDAATCNARCETETRRECIKDDDCCPDGCTTATDNDCSATCNNGFLDPGETCEKGVGVGCPTACPGASGCNAFMFTGNANACSSACVPFAIKSPAAGDSCCPEGANAKTDPECTGCGNHKLESGETCDGDCKTSCTDDSNACTIDAPVGNPDQCNVVCPEPSARAKKPKNAQSDGCCPKDYDSSANSSNDPDCAPVCGNNVKEAGELCDGDCPASCTPDGNPCTSDAVQGTSCSRSCSFPTITAAAADGCCVAGETYPSEAACPGCGNGRIDSGEECDDGGTAPGDGCSASCQFDDNWNTLGDDRPGYLVCGSTICGVAAGCSSGRKVTAPGTYQDVDECGRTTGFVNGASYAACDGSEDCPPNHKCAVGVDSPEAYCEQLPIAENDTIVCHRDVDCVVAGQVCRQGGPTSGLGNCR